MRLRLRSALAGLGVAGSLAFGARADAQRTGRGAPDSVATMRDSTRVVLEQRIRQRLWQVVRTRVGLNDDQMRKLEQVERSLDAERRELNRSEVATRAKLRAAALDSAGSAQDQQATDALIRQFFQLQHQRIALQEKEQQQLASFMTPVQRIRFHALEEQLRRRVEAIRGQRAGAGNRQALPRP